MLYLILIIIGYLIGSLSSAVIVSKILMLPDPRNLGSGNPGTTNVLRLGNKLGAALTLVGDTGKALVPILIVKFYITSNSLAITLMAISIALGHIYPLYFNFKGGKGVATSLGIFLVISPIIAGLQIITWLVFMLLFRYSSLSAIAAALLTPLYLWALGSEPVYIALGSILSVLILARHHRNIKRLIKKTETRFSFKR
ncbi:MAG: acyl-phosphate glycerol 3-phosphate acyltransferase [Acidiferrobacteraceae bacterium]|mgnify:CR=1 FL=1|nr:acyl-phosphate glycerol 3-phosphate acyltransferase [Acidiferrobacteraceae bacterium]